MRATLVFITMMVMAVVAAPDLGESHLEVTKDPRDQMVQIATEYVPKTTPIFSEEMKAMAENPQISALDVADAAVAADNGLTKLYRYYHPGNGDHFYTTNWNEIGRGKYGYKFEGVAGYVFSRQAEGSVPLHRWVNPYTGDHFYSINPASKGVQQPTEKWSSFAVGKGW